MVRRWVKAVNKANVLMRKDEAAALKYLKKYFPRMPDDVMALAMKEIMPALSADGTMNEQMMQKHLDFLKDTERRLLSRETRRKKTYGIRFFLRIAVGSNALDRRSA
ncbi:MAG: hypothetical protein WC690_09940 [bacterium]